MADDLELAKKIIYEHDLTPTVRRMVLINKWPKKHALEACKQYRNYLFLKKKYGNEYELPPSYEIDEFWHAHILHTESYYEFCKKVFGGFLHHHPHHGKDDKLTDNELKMMFENQTQKLYLQEFGEYMYAIKPIGFRMNILVVIEKIIEYLTFLKAKNPIYRS